MSAGFRRRFREYLRVNHFRQTVLEHHAVREQHHQGDSSGRNLNDRPVLFPKAVNNAFDGVSGSD
jgi:hypothetical protein